MSPPPGIAPAAFTGALVLQLCDTSLANSAFAASPRRNNAMISTHKPSIVAAANKRRKTTTIPLYLPVIGL